MRRVVTEGRGKVSENRRGDEAVHLIREFMVGGNVDQLSEAAAM